MPGPDARPSLSYHLLIFAPVAGLLITLSRLLRTPSEDSEARADLAAAARWQAAASFVLLLHLALQGGVALLIWLDASGPGSLSGVIPIAVRFITVVNLASFAGEYGFLCFWAVRASRGAAYPGLRGFVGIPG